jgi:hypothetical protein
MLSKVPYLTLTSLPAKSLPRATGEKSVALQISLRKEIDICPIVSQPGGTKVQFSATSRAEDYYDVSLEMRHRPKAPL